MTTIELTRRQKQIVASVILAGGLSGLHFLRKTLRHALKEQFYICSSASVLEGSSRKRRAPKVAVDVTFAKRLHKILKICVPGPFSPEAGVIYVQTACLVARTFLTDFSSRIEGGVGRCVRDALRTCF
jgi:hypothetical protein